MGWTHHGHNTYSLGLGRAGNLLPLSDGIALVETDSNTSGRHGFIEVIDDLNTEMTLMLPLPPIVWLG